MHAKNEKPIHGQAIAQKSPLVVLNEANEPEEEEDTYEDLARFRHQRMASHG